MSYCRIGELDSDVYLIRHVNGSLVCYCDYPGNECLLEDEMISHLREHQARSQAVPQRVFDRLEAERDGRPYRTDVQLALEEFRFGVEKRMKELGDG